MFRGTGCDTPVRMPLTVAPSQIVAGLNREFAYHFRVDAVQGRKPSIKADEVRRLRKEGLGATEIARKLGVGRASAYRVLMRRHRPADLGAKHAVVSDWPARQIGGLLRPFGQCEFSLFGGGNAARRAISAPSVLPSLLLNSSASCCDTP